MTYPLQTETSRDPNERLVGSDRVLAVLAELASRPDGASLEEIALRLAFAPHHETRPDHIRVHGILIRLAERFGETAHYGVLGGHSVVYRSKVDPPGGAMKLSSVVGGRNPAHATALGKTLLAAALPTEDAVAEWAGDAPLVRPVDGSVWTTRKFHEELERTRERGYGLDDQENEVGINCLAVLAYLDSPSTPGGAISVSGLAYRTPVAVLVRAADEVRAMVDEREGARG